MTQGLSRFLVVHPSPKKNPENYFKTVISMATKEEEKGQSYNKQFYIPCQLKQEIIACAKLCIGTAQRDEI